MPALTAEKLRSRATGALFFIVFGSAWLLLWLLASQRLTAATATVVGVGLLAGLAATGWVLRQVRLLPAPAPTPDAAGRLRRVRRGFGLVNAGQWAVIILAGWLLPRLGLTLYFTPFMVLVVGLHFFPLARLFGYRGHYLTGAALIAWAVGCVLLRPSGEWQATAALGAGLVLWLSAGYVLAGSIAWLRLVAQAGS